MRDIKLLPLFLFGVAFLAALLAACGEEPPEPTSTSLPSATADIEVTESKPTLAPENEATQEEGIESETPGVDDSEPSATPSPLPSGLPP